MSKVWYDERGHRHVRQSGGEHTFLALLKWFAILFFVIWPYAVIPNTDDGTNVLLGILWDAMVVVPTFSLVIWIKIRRGRISLPRRNTTSGRARRRG